MSTTCRLITACGCEKLITMNSPGVFIEVVCEFRRTSLAEMSSVSCPPRRQFKYDYMDGSIRVFREMVSPENQDTVNRLETALRELAQLREAAETFKGILDA